MVSPHRRPLVASVTRRLLSKASHDRRLAGGGEQGPVLGPDVGQPVAEAVGDGVDADIEQHPVGLTQLHDSDGVVETVAAGAHAQRLADARGHHVAEDRQRGVRHLEARDARPERGASVAGRTGELVHAAPLGHAHLPARRQPPLHARVDRAHGALRRRRHVRPLGPRAPGRELPLSEGGVDGEDLEVADVAGGSHLARLVTQGSVDHLDVDDRRRTGEGEVLGRRPDERAPRVLHHGLDGGAQPDATEQGAETAGDLLAHGEPPPPRFVGGLEAEELGGVHTGGDSRVRPMTTTPWLGDACSLVDALRAKELSPVEALEASLAAVDGSQLNAFSYVDAEAARAAAKGADVSLPFGGVPMGVKELQRVKGWPFTEASLVFKDDKADVDGTEVVRLRDAGAVLVGLTTASEIGFVNYTSFK